MKIFLKSAIRWILVFQTLALTGQFPDDTTAIKKGNFDTLQVKFPKIYWFNSYKFSIGDYAKGRSKQGINSTSHKSKRDHEENRTTYKFTITLEDKYQETSWIQGEFVQHERYVVSRGSFLEALTGIESESTEPLGTSSIKTIRITTSMNPQETWNLIIYHDNTEDGRPKLPWMLRSDTRIIEVTQIDHQPEIARLGIHTSGGYEFIENGVVIASVHTLVENIILFKSDQDRLSRLVITSAIMALIG